MRLGSSGGKRSHSAAPIERGKNPGKGGSYQSWPLGKGEKNLIHGYGGKHRGEVKYYAGKRWQ